MDPIYGQKDLSAATVTDITSIAATAKGSVNFSVCNRNASSVKVRLALSATTATQAAKEYIEYDATIAANGVLERTGIYVKGLVYFTAYSDTANVSVTVTGPQEGA